MNSLWRKIHFSSFGKKESSRFDDSGSTAYFVIVSSYSEFPKWLLLRKTNINNDNKKILPDWISNLSFWN